MDIIITLKEMIVDLKRNRVRSNTILVMEHGARDVKKLNNLIKKTGFRLGTNVEPLEMMMQTRILHKIKNKMDTSEYPHETVVQQQCIQSKAPSLQETLVTHI